MGDYEITNKLFYMCFSMESVIYAWIIFLLSFSLSPPASSPTLTPFPTSADNPSWLSTEGKIDGSEGHHPGKCDAQVLVPGLSSTN